MTGRRHVCRRTWLAVPLGMLLAALPAAGQEDPAQKGKIRVPPHGVQGFTRLLHHFKLRPLASFDALAKADARETLVVVFGDPSPLSRMAESGIGAAEFVEKGGALLVATDRPTGNALDDFEVEVAGDVVHQVGGYRGVRECPLIGPSGPQHPLFQGVRQLAAIQPSQVVPKGRVLFLSKLAVFPNDCMSITRGFRVFASPFIMGSDATSKHRVLVIGGHSVFMNVLVAQNDVDNFPFAVNAVRWLSDEGRRKNCLFVVDGSVAASFDVPLGGVPVPTAKLINKLLNDLEQEGFFSRLAQAILPRSLVLRLALYGATLFLAIYIFWRVWVKRHEVPREAPLLSARVAQAVPDRALLALRQQALVHEDNLWEVARSLARQCFGRHGLGGPSPPVVRATGSGTERRARQRSVLALWKLAFGPPRPVRARDFARVLGDVEAVDGWLGDGLVRLEFPPRPDPPRRGRVSAEISPN